MKMNNELDKQNPSHELAHVTSDEADNIPMGMLEDASYEAQCEAQGYCAE